MAYRTRRRGFVLSAVAAGLFLAAHNGHATGHAGGLLAAMSAPRGGTLSCSGLEALWESAGGSHGAAFMAAEIAQAESSGQQYAALTDGNGTVDRGYWQINSIHGNLSTFDAAGNARAAVQLSGNGTDWSPWVTYNTGAYQGKC
jgi:Lysozyme like domain